LSDFTKKLHLPAWLWPAVLTPLIVTRLALLLVGWYSLEFRPDSDYPQKTAPRTGWSFSPYRWLDIWGRWDSGFYMDIAFNGYKPSAVLTSEQSNMAFFPLYPYLVRALISLSPVKVQTQSALLVGVLLSNLFLFGALTLFYLLGREVLGDEDAARRAVWYLLLFPTAFVYSAFYSESTFLFFLILTFWAAQKEKWALAGIAGFFLALSRAPGILALPALGWMYLERWDWKLSRLHARILWLGLIPAGLAVFLYLGYDLTGDWLAPIHAQQAWQRQLTWPWVTLFAPTDHSRPHFEQMEWVALVGFLILSVYALVRLPSRSYGIFALLLLVPSLTSGSLTSVMRIAGTSFPVFLTLALLGGRWPFLDRLIWVVFLSLQAVLFAGWSQFYWAG